MLALYDDHFNLTVNPQRFGCCSPGRLKNDREKRVSEEGVQHPPVKGVHHEFILCDDVRIHVARAGMDASKKLILFLHGFPEYVLPTVSCVCR